MNRSNFIFPVLLVLLWVLMVCIVNPLGNFPLNDDWQYARPVSYLINHGYYFSPDEYSPIIIAQVFWGALFCLPGGFSFTALRVSVLVLGVIGILVFYFLINSISHDKRLSFFGALLLLVNPLYFSLSNTFMTDVPFLAFAIISIYLFIRALQIPRTGFLLLAIVFAILATLIRQFGLVIPIAYSIAAIAKNKPKLKQWTIYILPGVVTVVALELAFSWLKHIGSELHPYYRKSIADFLANPADVALHIFYRTGYIVFYSGFFLLPFTALSLGVLLRNLSRKRIVPILCLLVILFPSFIHAWHTVPVGNIINEGSLGPTTFWFENFWTAPEITTLPHFSGVFSLLCFAGAILLVINIGTFIVKADEDSQPLMINKHKIFIGVCIVAYAILMFIPNFFFDRYLIIFFPLFFLLICRATPMKSIIRIPVMVLSFILVFTTAIFSTAGTHNYLAWNRSRWDAWNYATNKLSISPKNIDGGYECNSWMVGQVIYDPKVKLPVYEYVLSFGPHDGYNIIQQFPYQNYLPCETRNIYLLHKN